MAQATNQRAPPLKYQGENTFLLDARRPRRSWDTAPESIKLVFELEGDRASGFTLYQGDQVVPGSRVDGTP